MQGGDTVDNIESLPEDLNTSKVSERSDANTHVYFGKLYPFSNFHKQAFTVEYVVYIFGEQYIQRNKVTTFGDELSASGIMFSDDPIHIKGVESRIKSNQKVWIKKIPDTA